MGHYLSHSGMIHLMLWMITATARSDMITANNLKAASELWLSTGEGQ